MFTFYPATGTHAFVAESNTLPSPQFIALWLWSEPWQYATAEPGVKARISNVKAILIFISGPSSCYNNNSRLAPSAVPKGLSLTQGYHKKHKGRQKICMPLCAGSVSDWPDFRRQRRA
jgi:hypothetical protein